MGNVGISNHEHKSIPLEIILQDGSMSTNKEDVLQLWKSASEQLLNTGETDPVSSIHIDIERSILNTTLLNSAFTIQEVRLALFRQSGEGIRR